MPQSNSMSQISRLTSKKKPQSSMHEGRERTGQALLRVNREGRGKKEGAATQFAALAAKKKA